MELKNKGDYTNLIFQKFKRVDFPEYLSWFEDSELDKQLGPMTENDEWLTSVLEKKEGVEYSIFQNGHMVAELGFYPSTKEQSYYLLSNLAVKPSLRGQGIGKLVLEKLMKLHPLKKGEAWRTYVDNENLKAKRFFEKSDWVCLSEPPENNNMFLLEWS